jgi:hypothetical protein
MPAVAWGLTPNTDPDGRGLRRFLHNPAPKGAPAEGPLFHTRLLKTWPGV